MCCAGQGLFATNTLVFRLDDDVKKNKMNKLQDISGRLALRNTCPPTILFDLCYNASDNSV